MVTVYLTFGNDRDSHPFSQAVLAHKLISLKRACNSFNNSISSFLKSQSFDIKGKSLRIQWCLKALFANWLYKILIIKSVMKQTCQSETKTTDYTDPFTVVRAYWVIRKRRWKNQTFV